VYVRVCVVAGDILIAVGFPAEPHALDPSFPPSILPLSLSDYISLAKQTQESLSVVEGSSKISPKVKIVITYLSHKTMGILASCHILELIL